MSSTTTCHGEARATLNLISEAPASWSKALTAMPVERQPGQQQGEQGHQREHPGAEEQSCVCSG